MKLSIALIQWHIKRRPLTSLQFDVQQKIKLILRERHFCACYFNVVTFTPENYAIKSNFSKHCCLCYDNEIKLGPKIQKK